MRFKTWLLSDVFGGIGRLFGITAAAALVLALSAAIGSAADVSAPGGDNLNVTGTPVKLLPQTQGSENGWLSGLHVSGYGSQTFGMWQNPTALKDFTASRNNLAVARSLLQVDENYRLNENNTFFMREWFVYEPPYSWDSANIKSYGLSIIPALQGITPDRATPSYGHFMNDWNNNYTVRDAWWENKTGPLTTYVGNQIVVWGQSLAFRVGDVVNPTDTTWAFGFANLEQSRNPQWMIHPILNLPEMGPLSSNFLELVVEPGFAPMWTENNYPDGRYYQEGIKAGRVITGAPSIIHGPSSRFDVHYDNRPVYGLNAPLITGPPYGPGGANIVAQPAAHEFWSCSQLAPLVKKGFIPKGTPQRPCALGLSKNNDPLGITGDQAITDIGIWRIPGMQPQNWNIGGRYHTLFGATELTALYYLDNTYGMGTGVPASLRWTPFTNLWTYQYPQVNEFGFTADRPLPMPASLAEYFPAVARAEMVYVNHASLTDMRPTSLTAQRYSDLVNWMAAVDLDQAYAPWLTSTGNLSANVEVDDTIYMDTAKTSSFLGSNDVSEHMQKNQLSILLNVGTSWWWSDFAPAWTMIYAPQGNTFLLFPSIVLNPPWTKKYFMKLQAIEVLGSDRLSPEGGLFKGESLLTAQFQYNFNLL
jgi:hypothetical protein